MNVNYDFLEQVEEASEDLRRLVRFCQALSSEYAPEENTGYYSELAYELDALSCRLSAALSDATA